MKDLLPFNNMLHQEEFDQLSDDLSRALVTLYEFKVVFDDNEKQLALLNNTAPFFFLRLYDFYWNELIMSISRLTDRSIQGKHNNLSIYILEDFAADLPSDKKEHLRANLETISKEADLIRKFRNKFISHRDKSVTKILPENRETLYVQKIEEVFSLIQDCINIFYLFYNNEYEDHKPSVVLHGSQTLLYYLDLGKTYEDIQDKMPFQYSTIDKI